MGCLAAENDPSVFGPIGRAAARNEAIGEILREEIDQKLEDYIKAKSNPQKDASFNYDFDQWTIHEITGAAPISKLLAAVGEEDRLHRNIQEIPENYKVDYWGNGTKVMHTTYVPGSCANPDCGVCNHYHDMQAREEEQQQLPLMIISLLAWR
jgi:hypothetical protein